MEKLLRPLLSAALLITSFYTISCTENNSDTDDSQNLEELGLYSVKDALMEIENFGGELTVTFLSLGDWSVSSDSEWCTPLTSEGEGGDVSLTFSVDPFGQTAADAERTAQVSISIMGYGTDVDLCQIRQASDVESQYTSGSGVNLWMSDYMSTNYLWNDEFNKIRSNLNYWTDADSFLANALYRMSGIEEDGSYYTDGSRYYYTNLTTYVYSSSYSPEAPETRAMSTTTGYGINMVYPVYASSTSYYFLIASITDESPAQKAGLRRGMYITKYNQGNISSTNLEQYYNELMGYSEVSSQAIFEISEYQQSTTGGSYSLKDLGTYYVTPATHTKNPIVFKGVYSDPNSGATIGHLVYSEFDMDADSYLLDIFDYFKGYNVSDLILDLRYNPGGDVYASTVMATAIAGSKYTGGVYCEMEYNAYRQALGQVDYFYIGQSPSMVTYTPIVDALDSSLNLDRVYVIGTGFTASASELIINGLRGLGVEVILIGETTEGKNSGMEVISSYGYSSDYDFGQYIYEFAPITFYNRNAEGFKDFHSGFTPDYEFTETSYYLFDWETGLDYCTQLAIYNILNDAWPASTSAIENSTLPILKSENLRPRAAGARVYRDDIILEHQQ